MKLTQEQITQFDKNGFLILRNFADNILCDKILTAAKKNLAEKTAPVEREDEYLDTTTDALTIRRLRQVYDREDIFKTWMTNKEIKPILHQLLEDVPVLILAHHNSIMTKMPSKSSRTSWHQDYRYWNYENDNLISIWLSLDKETLENGLLEFIPHSHKINFTKDQFDAKSNFLDNNIINKKLIKTAVHSNLNRGDVVLFHCKTLHHANKNRTKKPKISFVYTVRAKANMSQKDTRSEFKEVIL